jgi:hypothetical protein
MKWCRNYGVGDQRGSLNASGRRRSHAQACRCILAVAACMPLMRIRRPPTERRTAPPAVGSVRFGAGPGPARGLRGRFRLGAQAPGGSGMAPGAWPPALGPGALGPRPPASWGCRGAWGHPLAWATPCHAARAARGPGPPLAAPTGQAAAGRCWVLGSPSRDFALLGPSPR